MHVYPENNIENKAKINFVLKSCNFKKEIEKYVPVK